MARTKEDWTIKKGSSIVEEGVALNLTKRFLFDGANLLDVGSGNGLFLRQAKNFSPGLNAFGLDTENFIASDIRKKVSFETLKAEDAWPFEEGKFQVITAWNVVEHLDNPSLFAKRAAKALVPRGHILLSMPNIFNLLNRFYFLRTGDMYRFKSSNSHITIITKLVFKKVFQDFEVVSIGFSGVEPPFEFLRKISFIKKVLPESELFGKTIYYVLRKKN
ncbi:MAG: class I SAM-dependent methyltransferase [bacterium]|nr:class I SAM-dependent methyltransferase [bacterium]